MSQMTALEPLPAPAWYRLPDARRQESWRKRLKTPWPFDTRWSLTLPMVWLIGLTILFRNTNLDLLISSWFYDPEARLWHWFFWGPCTAFYRLGIYPPIILFSFGIALLLFGPWLDGTSSLRRTGAFLFLLMVIGPGLIVNLGFKTHWGRARPHEVQEFGGLHPHTLVGTPGPLATSNSSFPSGHAALAFYLMAPGFLISRRYPRWRLLAFLVGVFYGLGMSAARVAQGGHFASDVLMSGGLIYLIGVLLARVVLRVHRPAAS